MLAALVTAAACSTDSVSVAEPVDPDLGRTEPTVSSTTVSSTTVSPPSSTTVATTTTVPPPTELVLDEEGVPVNGQTTGVVITPTGIVVPVLGALDEGWRVWTPCGRVADVTDGTFLATVDVVLDPGHGGSESGAVGPGGTLESDLNLRIATRAGSVLEDAGRTVLLTRTDDVRIPIVTRAEIALALSPRVFVSIHHNGGTDAPSPTPGTEMFFQVADPESRRLAGLLYEETRAVLDGYDADWVSMADAGAMVRLNRDGGDYYGVLRRTPGVTSVLAEFAYIANASEEALLVRDDVQDGLAAAVGRAVDRLLTTDDPGSGYTEDPIFRGYESSGTGRTTDCTDPALQ